MAKWLNVCLLTYIRQCRNMSFRSYKRIRSKGAAVSHQSHQLLPRVVKTVMAFSSILTSLKYLDLFAKFIYLILKNGMLICYCLLWTNVFKIKYLCKLCNSVVFYSCRKRVHYIATKSLWGFLLYPQGCGYIVAGMYLWLKNLVEMPNCPCFHFMKLSEHF